jgi:cytochrome c oxidase assembly factor CtaG
MMITAHWSANPAVLAACAVTAGLHLTGLLRGPRAAGQRASGDPGQTLPGGPVRGPSAAGRRGGRLREALIFYAGLVTVLTALVSPLGYWSGRYIWVRAIQDLMLATIAPPLIVLGAPWLPLRRGLDAVLRPGGAARRGLDAVLPPGGAARRGLAAVRRGLAAVRWPGRSGPAARDRRVPWWLTRPALVAVAFNLVWLLWHVPALFDFARTSRAGAAAEIISYLALGIAFWLALVGSAPMSPRLTPLHRVTLVFGTVTVDTVLGMVLVFGSGLLYPAYRGGGHRVLSVVADQQVAGAVLWMGLLPTFIVLAVALFLRWLNDEEATELTTGLERLLGPHRYTWPSGRGAGGD